MRPNLAFVRTPAWSQAEPDMQEGFSELVDALGASVDEVDLPKPFEQAHAMHGAIMLADLARNFARYYDNGRDRMSDRLASMIEEGRKVLAVDYALAHDWIEVLNAVLDEIFIRYDAILTPAVGGEAPLGLESTGSPAFCTIWTYCGVPAITLPLLSGENGMPIGVQLVGARGNDARLLRTARWLVETLRNDSRMESPE